MARLAALDIRQRTGYRLTFDVQKEMSFSVVVYPLVFFRDLDSTPKPTNGQPQAQMVEILQVNRKLPDTPQNPKPLNPHNFPKVCSGGELATGGWHARALSEEGLLCRLFLLVVLLVWGLGLRVQS